MSVRLFTINDKYLPLIKKLPFIITFTIIIIIYVIEIGHGCGKWIMINDILLTIEKTIK